MLRGISKHSPALILALALFLTAGGVAFAQTFGRVTVVVSDDQGNPLEGVKVVVTTPELGSFREEKTTNKKGRVTVSVTDATKTYDFHFEKEGFPSANFPIKPQVKGSVTREITMSQQPAAPSGVAGGVTETVYTPAERVFNEGVVALQGGDMATAKTKFIEALDKDPGMTAAHSAVAGIHLEEKNYEAALQALDTLMALDPANARAYLYSYEAHKALGNAAEADAALEQLTKLDKGGDTAKLIFNAGVAAARDGLFDAAAARFQQALDLDPNLTPAMGALGIVYINQKKYAEAATMAERLLAVEPDNPKALRVRWDAYRGLGDAAKTEEAMQALAAKDPAPLIREFMQKGLERFNNGDTAGAIANFEGVLALDADHPRAHYHLGVSQVSTGDAANAKTHLQKFIELAPSDPEAAVAKDMLGYLE